MMTVAHKEPVTGDQELVAEIKEILAVSVMASYTLTEAWEALETEQPDPAQAERMAQTAKFDLMAAHSYAVRVASRLSSLLEELDHRSSDSSKEE